MVDRPGGATSTARTDTTPANGDAGGPPRSDGGFGNTLDQAQGTPQEKNNALEDLFNSLSPEFKKMFMEALAQLLSGAGGGGGPAGGGGNSGSGSGDGISLEDIMKLLSIAQADQQASNQAQGQGAGTDTGSGQQSQPTAA